MASTISLMLANDELDDAEKYIHKVLAERFVMEFRADGKLVIDWGVAIERRSRVSMCGMRGNGGAIALLKPPNCLCASR